MKFLPKAVLFCALTALLTATETPKVGVVAPSIEAVDQA